ncbi:helix-turn-helix transcriptional regulator [Proteiniborus sp. DW1]|uniref:helix-turn-helix domain-containing protein n=1 Tax=Proteiniborus sp. DW1 TaxID=1889883 RepID=UPI000941F524|nr:helix-turn-helix transcriptional regulator [Proteiniborus sp. DW1]
MEEHFEVTVGQNLKRIRKDLGLRQHQIAGEDITRNLISLIENDKATLYDTAANIMARNINKIMSEKNLNIFIKPEDLLNPKRYNARKKADTYIERLEDDLINKKFDIKSNELNEIEAFLNEWDLTDKKVKIYELLGDIFYASNNSNKEYYYYFKALESSYDFPNMKGRYKIALKLVFNCIVTGKCDEAINLCKYMLLSQNDIPDMYKGVFYYNSALAYKKLKEYDNCLNNLDIAKKYIDDTSDNFKKILMLEGISYYETKNYNKALVSYEKFLEILGETNRFDEICATYINIVQIHIKRNDKESILKYFDKIMTTLPYIDDDSFYLTEIYYEISNVFLYLNNYEESEKYLNTALASSKKFGMHNLYKKFLGKLMELYINTNSLDKLSDLLKTIDDEIINIRFKEDFILVLKLLLYFIKQNNYKEAENLIIDLLQKKEV